MESSMNSLPFSLKLNMGAERYSGEPEDVETGLRGIAYSVLIIFPVILLITGCWNLYLASELGDRMGYNLSTLFKLWLEGLDITEQYSNTYLMTTRRFSNALWQLSAAVVTIVAAIILAYKNMARNKK
jgi:hypothetical protein